MKFARIFALAALVSSPAYAATSTYTFSAVYSSGMADDDTVSTVADVAEGLRGTTLTGTITLDDTFVSGDSVRRLYAAPSITIDQMDLSAVLPFSNTVLQNAEFSFDGYTLVADLPNTIGEVVSQIFITLRDNDKTIIGDTGFPPLPDLSEFESTTLAFIGNVTGETNARERVNFEFTSLVAAQAVPLPAGGVLLLSGLAGLAVARRRGSA
jgi:hypothetical protein